MFDMSMIKTPKEIIEELDKHIIGQMAAKRAVAIALRNRYRRKCVISDLRDEITPKNILMIGSTGVGKTEIARRLAKLDNAPFIKVEATKFTEIGYVGRDVESIIRDLTDIAVKLVKEEEIAKVKCRAEVLAEEEILNILLFVDGNNKFSKDDEIARQLFRKKLREKSLDDKEIEIEIKQANLGVGVFPTQGMEEMTNQLHKVLQSLSCGKKNRKKLTIRKAFKLLKDEESMKLLDEEDIKHKAIERIEQSGIVFLDEIDKIVQSSDKQVMADVSRGGVQRDLLPLIEGSSVVTKHGIVKTNHILFIAAGAFHISKPSDLIPELQGRLPIKVKLNSLQVEDFVRILVEPKASLIKQYKDLLRVEGMDLNFTKDSIRYVAELAYKINEHTENIGARRLHTVMEKLLENILFDTVSGKPKYFLVNVAYVHEQLDKMDCDYDVNKFIL